MSEEKKSTYTAARKRAVTKYLSESVDEIKVRVPKGKRDYYKSAAAAAGLSLNEFAVSSMDERIERDRLRVQHPYPTGNAPLSLIADNVADYSTSGENSTPRE